MTYALSTALQATLYGALTGDSELTQMTGGACYDAVPPGVVPETYLVLGEENVRSVDDATGQGAIHTITVSVFSSLPSFVTAKAVAARVVAVLEAPGLSLEGGTLVSLIFQRAQARRTGAADTRRIDLRFRARVDQTT